MFTKTISYTDYDGNNRNEKFYFNLSKAEAVEWQNSIKGGLADHIQKIIDAEDQTEIIQLFKVLILKSYGEKSEDGRRFIKSKEISEAFSQTEAYSELFMELATNDKAAADFVNGVLPTIEVKPEEIKSVE